MKRLEKVNNMNTCIRRNWGLLLYFVPFVLINIAYISIEIYKSIISEPLLLKAKITRLEFLKLETLSTYAWYLESAIIVLMFASVLFVCTKKYRSYLKSFIVVHLVYIGVFLLLGNILSWIFVAPVGNLTQQLIYPIMLLLVVLLYYIITVSTRKLRVSHSSKSFE